MSISVMSLVFKAKINDIQIGDKRITAPILKFVLIALADHCNDDGDGAYPSLTTLEHKTALSHQSVINAIEGLKHEGLIIRVGISKRGTSNYSLNVPMLKSLVHLVDYQPAISIPGSDTSTPGSDASTPGSTTSQPGLPEPSLTVLKSSINQDAEKTKKSIAEDYWNTLIEIMERVRDVPPANRVKIALGKPISFQDGTLTIQHPETEWANQRFAKTFTNLIQGIHPGAAVKFAPPGLL